MSDFCPDLRDPQSNQAEFTVSELSSALKRTVEDSYRYVRVRGEISGFKRAASGHLYMTLKDESAVIDGVCWKGIAGRLSIIPEDGLEVIATGKITTYAARSKYQIVIDQIEVAGEGALLKLLEDRRKKLTAEGLFDPDRKQTIPYLPSRIGVVTSPTGAVIRDILQRLKDRYPRPVLLWPVLVQGESAAQQLATAINGFNNLPEDGPVVSPDLIIVARGGGSLEVPHRGLDVLREANRGSSRSALLGLLGFADRGLGFLLQNGRNISQLFHLVLVYLSAPIADPFENLD